MKQNSSLEKSKEKALEKGPSYDFEGALNDVFPALNDVHIFPTWTQNDLIKAKRI